MLRQCLIPASTLAAILLVSACAVPQKTALRTAPPSHPAVESQTGGLGWLPGVAAAPRETRRLSIDPAQSVLQILVYRAGPLAALGHNHVVASHDLTGTAELSSESSSFELRIPVSSLTIDEPQLRAAHGDDFNSNVDAAARAGTRDNMLGARVLDAARFPAISVTSTAFAPRAGSLTAHVALEVLGRSHELDIPLTLMHRGDAIRAEGRLRIKQTELGLAPFSIFGGALQVKDELEVEFSAIAVAPAR